MKFWWIFKSTFWSCFKTINSCLGMHTNVHFCNICDFTWLHVTACQSL